MCADEGVNDTHVFDEEEVDDKEETEMNDVILMHQVAEARPEYCILYMRRNPHTESYITCSQAPPDHSVLGFGFWILDFGLGFPV